MDMHQVRSKQIFLVEDNPGDAALVTEALREIGADTPIEVALDGSQGWERLVAMEASGTLPDLIILNFNLPRVSGPELLRRIQSHPVLARVPIIMLTSTSSESDRAACAGVQDYLIKASTWEDTLGVAHRIVQLLNSLYPISQSPQPGTNAAPDSGFAQPR